MKKTLFFILLGALLSRCESAGTGEPVAIPNVEINCTDSVKCAPISGTHEVVVNITGSGCAYNQIDVDLQATGTANVICNGSSQCVGTVTSWRANSQTITQIPSSTYSICGWLDNDGLPGSTAGDAFAEESMLVTGAPITLSDWDAQNERSTQRAQTR